jgi:hypothetical protein
MADQGPADDPLAAPVVQPNPAGPPAANTRNRRQAANLLAPPDQDPADIQDPANIPLAQAVPVFALTPALYNTRVIDYSTQSGIKIFNKSVEKLQDTPFDIDADGLHSFLNAVQERADSFGWEHILMVPKDILFPDEDHTSLTRNFGELSMEQVRDHALTYMHNQCRAAQDSHALYLCLMNSLSTKGKDKVTLYRHDYYSRNQPSGPLLLKLIIRECRIDTRATVRHIRAKLSSLPSYLSSINFNIPEFNRYVLGLVEQLRARGTTTHDLLANLFVAYESATDRDFVNFIKQRKQQYDMGADIDEHMLMQYAQVQYQIQIEDGTWAKPTPDQERIVALETKFNDYKKKHPSSSNNTGSGKGKNNKSAKGKKGKGNNKSNSNNTSDQAWRTKPPKNNERHKSKKVDDRTYWWCPHHKSWCMHKAKDCRLATNSGTNNTNSGSAPTSGATTTPSNHDSAANRLRLTSAVTALQEEDE